MFAKLILVAITNAGGEIRGLMLLTVNDNRRSWIVTVRKTMCHDWVFKTRLQSSARVPVQSNSERVRISWSSAEASRQCCLCSLSSAPLPGVQAAYGKSVWVKVLGSNPSWIPDFCSVDLFLTLSRKKKKKDYSLHGCCCGTQSLQELRSHWRPYLYDTLKYLSGGERCLVSNKMDPLLATLCTTT